MTRAKIMAKEYQGTGVVDDNKGVAHCSSKEEDWGVHKAKARDGFSRGIGEQGLGGSGRRDREIGCMSGSDRDDRQGSPSVNAGLGR